MSYASRNGSVKLESKVLQFEFNFSQVQFNKNGKYFLRFTIQNSHREDLLTQAKLEQNNDGKKLTYREVVSDPVIWDGTDQSVSFSVNSLKYTFPKGFCKNDNNYDVTLTIEAVATETAGRKFEQPTVVGEAKFAIYPRTDAPRANLLVRRGENYYKYSGIITLLRPFTKSSISMHCGRISYSVAFREDTEATDREDQNEEIEAKPLPPDPKPKPQPRPSRVVRKKPVVLPIKEPEPLKPEAEEQLTDYRQRQRDRLRAVNTKPASPPKKKETRSIEVQTQSPITSATSDRYYATNGIGADGLLEPHSKDQATSTTEDLLEGDIHISISSRDQIPALHTNTTTNNQTYRRSIDSPTGIRGKKPGQNGTLDSFGPTTGSQPETRTKKKRFPDPPRKIIRKTNTNITGMNGVSSQGASNEQGTRNNTIIPIRHVSKPGYEDVYVAIHGATSLPSCSDGSDPTPFASLKSGTEERGNVKAVCTTHASYRPTHSPTWEEAFTLQIPEGKSSSEEIVLSIADSQTKDQLVSYQIPMDFLHPFHTYHLELVQSTPLIPHGIRMYVTIQRKLSHLQRIKEFGYCALEVTLRDVLQELKNPPGSLLAVARIVPDYSTYKERMLSSRPYAAGILPQIINFPAPQRHHFDPNTESMQGYPQLSLPSTSDRQPEWGHTFLFSHNEAATMFSKKAAVVIEYYPASNVITPVTWAVKSPVGFSVVHLDEDTLQALTSDPGRLGIRIDDVLLQGSNYETIEGPYPSVRLVLRLINTERPDTMVAAGNVEMLPPLDNLLPSAAVMTSYTPTPQMVADEYFQRTQTPFESSPVPLTSFGGVGGGPPNKLLVKEDEFPPDDAIENILPEYSLTPKDLQLYNVPTNSTIPRPRQGPNNPDRLPGPPTGQASGQGLSKQASNITNTSDMKSAIDERDRELGRYRDAVKRMSHDIVNLRQENLSLKSNNQLLRHEADNNQLSYRSTIPATNHQPGVPVVVDTMDSAELAQELDEVNQKLARDSLDLQKYKSKVQHLQNQVIKANEREKNYLNEQMTRSQLEDTIHDLQQKVKKNHKLEETVLKQEKVILKMEDLLKKYQKKEAQDKEAEAKKALELPAKEEVLASLTKQNNRLHLDLQKAREDKDKNISDLQSRLQRAENRASTLEQQLVTNAREWAREKQELTVRLQEHRNGIIRKNAS